MQNYPRTALITGICGFTGRYMAEELQKSGYRVIGIGTARSVRKDYYQVDLLDANSLKRVLKETQPDVVIHLAAVAFVGHGDANDFYRVNIVGTRNVLEAVMDMGKMPEAILLPSSANIYGNSTEGILNEGAAPAPANDYAVSKLAMEYTAKLYSGSLPIILARPFNYTGVGQEERFLIPKIVNHFRSKASTLELGNLDVWRDFSDVRSVVQAYRLLIETPSAYGQVVNVCSGQVYSLQEIIKLCEEIVGYSIAVRVNLQYVRNNEIRTLCGDPSALQRMIGADWKPLRLIDTLKWMLSA